MNDKVLQEIDLFMSNLSMVNELHHPNDERRLYNIALEAVKANEGVPRDEMWIAFENAVEVQELNVELFTQYYPKYINVLERAYDILNRINQEQPFDEHFKF